MDAITQAQKQYFIGKKKKMLCRKLNVFYYKNKTNYNSTYKWL